MAFDDYDELEQGEQVRKWIKENWLPVTAGVVLAFVLIFGYRQWKAHTLNNEMQAAAQFATLEQSLQADSTQAASAALGDLQKNYDGSAYAVFASAAMARYNVGKNQLKPAAENLQWAVAHARDPALKSLFALRYVRVLLAQNQAQQALAQLNGIPAGDYSALADELRGDALLQLGKSDGARSAYQDALGKLDKDAPMRGSLQLKLDNLTQPPAASTGK